MRECHGDLHAGNICLLDDEVLIYDCIEFNRRFRCGDVASEIAFLAMDLDQRGYPGFASYLVRRYALEAGDEELRELERFYKGYRALVRCKVAALTAAGAAEGEREQPVAEAMRYGQLASAYELPPAMILTCGLPASGKSWLARAPRRLAARGRPAQRRAPQDPRRARAHDAGERGVRRRSVQRRGRRADLPLAPRGRARRPARRKRSLGDRRRDVLPARATQDLRRRGPRAWDSPTTWSR